MMRQFYLQMMITGGSLKDSKKALGLCKTEGNTHHTCSVTDYGSGEIIPKPNHSTFKFGQVILNFG